MEKCCECKREVEVIYKLDDPIARYFCEPCFDACARQCVRCEDYCPLYDVKICDKCGDAMCEGCRIKTRDFVETHSGKTLCLGCVDDHAVSNPIGNYKKRRIDDELYIEVESLRQALKKAKVELPADLHKEIFE